MFLTRTFQLFLEVTWQLTLHPKTWVRGDARAPGIYYVNRTVTFACFHENMNWPFCCSLGVTYLRKHSQLQKLAVSPFLHKRQICFYHSWSVKLLSSLIFPLKSRLARWDFIWNVMVFAIQKISAFQNWCYHVVTKGKEDPAQQFRQRSSSHGLFQAVGLGLTSIPLRLNHFNLLFVGCKTQITHACANLGQLEWQKEEIKWGRVVNTLRTEGNCGHRRGGHSIKFWWRSQAKTITTL